MENIFLVKKLVFLGWIILYLSVDMHEEARGGQGWNWVLWKRWLTSRFSVFVPAAWERERQRGSVCATRTVRGLGETSKCVGVVKRLYCKICMCSCTIWKLAWATLTYCYSLSCGKAVGLCVWNDGIFWMFINYLIRVVWFFGTLILAFVLWYKFILYPKTTLALASKQISINHAVQS